MNGQYLRFYVHEHEHIHRVLLWQWLLQQAMRMGIRGGSAFRAMAGFGSHHMLYEDHFFELAGTLTIEVQFVVSEAEAQRLLELVERENVRMFYALIPARFGVLNPRPDEAAPGAPGAGAA